MTVFITEQILGISDQILGVNTSVAILDDGYFHGGYRIVANDIARTNISANQRKAGMIVQTLDNNKEWMLGSDGYTWRTLKRLPDLTLLDDLSGPLDFTTRYYGSTGSDETGDGTLAKPYRDHQRCVDSVPRGCSGSLFFQALDAGPFTGCSIPDLRGGAGLLSVVFIGAGAGMLDINAIGGGSVVPNPTGGDKQSRVNYAGAAHGIVANGTHWVHAEHGFFGYPYIVGATVDGESSVSPALHVVTYASFDIYSQGYNVLEVKPYVSIIEDDPLAALNIHAVPQSGAYDNIRFIGFKTQAGYISISGAVSVQAFSSVTADAVVAFNTKGASYLYYDLFSQGAVFLQGEGANKVYLSGLFKGTGTYAVEVSGVDGAVGPAIIRTTANTKLTVGTFSPAGPVIRTGMSANIDFEGVSTVCCQSWGASTRWYDDGSGSSTDGQSVNFLRATQKSFVNLREDGQACIFGSTTGVAVTLQEGTQARGFKGHGTTPALRGATPGNDIIIGSRTAIAFSSLPATDSAEAIPHFCRSS